MIYFLVKLCNLFCCITYTTGVQISGHFATGYPELFFERVPGRDSNICYVSKHNFKKERVGTPEAAHVDMYSMNSLDLLCSTIEQCRINFRKSQTYRINFGNPSIYEIKCIFCTNKFSKNFNLC